jgi:glycine C-acetyltransferase
VARRRHLPINNHASIIDGCQARRAHCGLGTTAALAAINENAGTYRRALVVTDGVFSMDGDIAPLPELYDESSRHGLMFMVDDAHGEGVLGKGGRGIVDHFGLHGKVDIEVGTLSKAFGVVGGGSRQQDHHQWLGSAAGPSCSLRP